jgi:uncharacterized protein
MLELIFTSLTLGFFGSLHCIGMCGPIALALPLDRSTALTKTAGILSYNAGRLFTYSFLGALFGLFGYGLVLSGFQQTFSIVMGILIIGLVFVPGLTRWIRVPSLISVIGKLRSLLSPLFQQKGYRSLFLIGTLNGLLPCGLVYLGITGAIVTGNAQRGSLFMATFGAGTLPAMFTLSMLSNALSGAFREKIRRAMPVVIVSMGLLLILRGLNLGIPMVSPEMSSVKPECNKCCHK